MKVLEKPFRKDLQNKAIDDQRNNHTDNLIKYLIVMYVCYLFSWMTSKTHNLLNQVSSKIDDSDIVSNKSYIRKEKLNSTNKLSSWGLNLGP